MVKTEITMHLSKEVAQFVFDICYNVGGPSAATRRKHADDIIDALHNLGINYTGADIDPDEDTIKFLPEVTHGETRRYSKETKRQLCEEVP
jgi:hypothetical protein